MKSSKKRAELAKLAYSSCEDYTQIEKYIKVCNQTFEMCIKDMPEHYKEVNRKRGFIRTYHKPFFTEYLDGEGRTFQMGIVFIIDEEAEINQEYDISENGLTSREFREQLSEALQVKKHRLVDLGVGFCGEIIATLSPQRYNFDD